MTNMVFMVVNVVCMMNMIVNVVVDMRMVVNVVADLSSMVVNLVDLLVIFVTSHATHLLGRFVTFQYPSSRPVNVVDMPYMVTSVVALVSSHVARRDPPQGRISCQDPCFKRIKVRSPWFYIVG